jgi:subtilisin family serine protease
MLSSIKHKTGRKPANGAVSAEGDVSSPNAAFAAVKVKHPFFVQLSGCDTTCHASLAAHFGQNNYSPLTSSIVQVVGELDGLTDTAYGPHVSDVFPLLPQMKTSRTVSNDVVSGTGCDDRAKYSLVIEIVPMDADDVRSLIETIRLTFPNCYIKDEKLASDRRNFVTIDVPCEEVGATMKYLSTLSEVTFIDKKVKMQLLNRWATALSQSGAATGNYIHDMNITGEGQIISVADSGLDMNSCYFFDKNVPTPYDVTNYTHRKVVRYDTYVDGVDDDGHGTHVAGSAAGFSCEDYGDFHKHDGNAKGAKIAFFDMHSIVKNTLEVPSDLFTGLFEPVYLDTNARIFSNSWGSSSPPTRGYSEYAFQVDKFMWEYPDALVIFAAGNGGNDPNPTVLSPAISKNCIAVGAAMSDVDAWKNWFITDSPPSGYNSNGIADFSSYGPTKDGRLKPDLSAAGKLSSFVEIL